MTRFLQRTLMLLVLSCAFLPFSSAIAESTLPKADCVVLLHGLARTYRSMTKMEDALSESGYQVANIDYLSREQRVEELARTAVTQGIERCNKSGAEAIHFVTHSLGAMLVRYYLGQNELANLGRVVMLAPPNQGSEVVDAWRNVPGYFWLNGPAGDQLGTDADGIARQLGPVTYPVGIVAGTRSINLILSLWLPNPDDGKVSVERTKVDGMTDFLTMPVAHPFIASNEHVIEQTLNFLRVGKFDHLSAKGLDTPSSQERGDQSSFWCTPPGRLACEDHDKNPLPSGTGD